MSAQHTRVIGRGLRASANACAHRFALLSLILVITSVSMAAHAQSHRTRTEEARYEDLALAIVHVGALADEDEGDGTSWRVVRGLRRFEVDHEAFFNSVARPDLAQQAAERRSLRTAVKAGGYALAAVGLAGIAWGFAERDGPLMLGGVGVAVLGGGVRTLAGAIDPTTVTERDARQLTEAYNDRLRSPTGTAAPAALLPAAPITWSPMLWAGGGGLILRGHLR